ncbi:kinase-like protein [Meira miltonrushii]|uniref:non-specific serine/threonine protein kinase n=1 Tax=Meira miltonrushii TaxID=1280837 RepID=A0A316VC19_9BASI|nr:kinase-like protein [Meira miltonrushii]PWN33521.1 kinase-like protein [Meira miltonrushii]
MPSVATPSATLSSHSSSQKKFNTISALSNKSNTSATTNAAGTTTRASVKGLFEKQQSTDGVTSKTPLSALNGHSHFSGSSNKRNLFSPEAAAAVAREDGPWSVSVAEAQQGTHSEKRDLLRKKAKPSAHLYTLYVTTPTHNLTLIRSSTDLVELDQRIRENQSSSASGIPALPSLPVAQAAPTGRKFLQTISRTLSPSGHKNRSGLSQLTSANSGSTLDPASLTASPSKEASIPSAPISPAKEDPSSVGRSTAHSTTTQLATYLTTISNLPLVKRHKAWKRFVRVGSDDLESVRVERRVRKIRSDLAKHVKSAVAPANTNVAATPSHSDIGEEGGRTDDDRSFSGRSTSHSFRADRQDASGGARSSSTDGERSNRGDEVRKNKNFAGIPEENEKQEIVKGDDANNGAVASSSRSANDPANSHKRERRQKKRTDEKVTVDDFDMIRVLGKGCAGKVLLVRHKPTKGLFAMKSIHKRHVLAHQELQHTLTEQAVLKRMAKEVMDPFVVKLWWSFHDVNNLYLIMDFHPGGDLATQLSRWGRLGRDRARFYAAEIVEGVEGLHRAGVIYRDLKPENVLIGVDGHIVLSDFGLSKEFPVRGDMGGSSTPPPGHSSKDGKGHWMSISEDARSTSSASGSDAFSTSGGRRSRWMDDRDVTTTFCGTAEYLAPEVIQGAAYSYEVDWWSFGTMLYEMLTGITPFWADTHADMYVRVLHDELVFPDDRVLDQDTKSILRGLLQRNPMLRMKEPRIKKHPYFSMIEWDHVFNKRYIPPYIPPTNPLDETDTQNFDETFLDMKPVVNGGEEGEGENDEEGEENGNEQKSGQTSKDIDAMVAARRAASDGKSLFDGYSFRGRKDSGSIRSSIFSSEQSDDILAPANNSANTTASTDSTSEPVSKKHIVEEDDDDAAARAAVAALDHLEREAALSEANLSNPPTPLRGGTKDEARSASPTKPPRSATQQKTVKIGVPPATITEADREEDDDDWDMVDAPTTGEQYMSEINGGKGQNLFARGVVDTYRLLRRQESSRLPLAPSYSGRSTFNRLSRKQKPSGRESGGSVSTKGRTSNANSGNLNVGNESAVSLGSKNGNEGHLSATGANNESDASLDEASQQTKAGSPSLASSDEVNSADRLKQQKIKKMKRFTNFFETSR